MSSRRYPDYSNDDEANHNRCRALKRFGGRRPENSNHHLIQINARVFEVFRAQILSGGRNLSRQQEKTASRKKSRLPGIAHRS
jgi:hypothetical protein